MLNYNFLVLGFVVAAVLLVSGIDESWADWSFEGFIGESYYCPGSSWPDTCWFNSVQDVAVDQSDNIYVATFYPQKIYKLNSAGNNVQEYSLPDKAREVDVDGAGNVYVSLGQFSQTTIVKYDSSGNLLSESNGYSGNIVDFAVDDAGDIYIIYGTNELRKFESDPCCGSGSGHNLIFNISYQGDSMNEIEVDQRTGKVYLGLGSTLKILDSSGNELTPAGGIIPTGGTITGIDVDSAGNIYISDNNVGLQKFDSSASPGSGQGTSSTINPTASAPFDLTSYSTISPGSEFAVNGAGDVYANGGHAVLKFSHVEPVQGSFTIDSFEIFEESGHTKFRVGGDMPEPFVYRSMTYLITDSNGNIVYDYPSYTTSNGEEYGLNGPLFWKVTSYNQGNPTGGEYIQEYDGDFTLKICAPEIDQCMEKEFTISNVSATTGPFTITDDSTGGDCTSIGTWSSASKTCQLTTNLTHGIIIGSNDITLDGNGKTITGTYTALNPSAATFSEGIMVDGKTGVTLSNVSIYNVPTGIYLSSSENNWIVHSRLIDNGYGVSLYDSANNQITNTAFNSEDGYGIKVDRSHLNVISSNTFFGASSGISVSNSNQLTIDDNTFLSNQHGVYLHSVGSISVLDNIFESNSQSGMRIDGAGWHIITGNTFKDGLEGIQCSGSESNTISNNIITNNKPSNFGLAGTSQAMSFGTCSNNVISNNQITNNNQGIELNSSDGNTVSSNTISNNDGNAIRLLGGSGNIITDNTANNNQGIGFLIESNSDPVTFTNNTATGNSVNDFEGISQGTSGGIVSVDSLNIGQLFTKNGGDCDSVGTWVPSPTGFDVGGTCTLTKDIQITGTEVGITIASSGVTLDGAGHTVTGTQTAGYDHVGVKTCNQCYHMAIKNLEITNFAYGIFSNYAHGLIITGVTVTDVGKTAMSLGGSSRLIVEGNTIDVNIPNSWYGGINIHTNNAYAHLANRICVATDSMYSTNMIIGPWEWREGLVVIKNNVINGAALSISEQDGYCIDGNTISDSPGMLVSNSNNNMIKNNVITAGDLKIAGSGSTLDSNTVTGGSIGFHNTGTANIFTNNIANDNSQHGFKFEPDTPPLTFTDNVATGNGVSDIEGYAVAVDDPLSDIDLKFVDDFQGNGVPVLVRPYPFELPALVAGGSALFMQTSVENTGDGSAMDVDVHLLVTTSDGNIWKDFMVYNNLLVPANAEGPQVIFQSPTVPVDFPAGIYTYTYTIDPDNEHPETNENNNVYTGTFEVLAASIGSVDLKFVDDFQGNGVPVLVRPYPFELPALVAGGSALFMQTSVENTGDGSAMDVDVHLLVTTSDGNIWKDFMVYNNLLVPANAEGPQVIFQSPTVPVDFPAGIYTYTYTIDPDNEHPETNENNNVYTGTFEVLAASIGSVDLKFVDDFQGNGVPVLVRPYPFELPALVAGGSALFMQTSVENTGDGSAMDVDVHLLVTTSDGNIWKDFMVYNNLLVPANAEGPQVIFQSPTVPVDFPAGIYTYTYTIDPDNEHPETNENNNVYTGTFEVFDYAETCFTSAGFDAPWISDPDTSSRDAQISGTLTSKQNGECLYSNAFSIEGQSVIVTATKNGVIKTATATTSNVGLFNSIITFDDDSDEGVWSVVFNFEGQGSYLPTTELIFGDDFVYGIIIPAPPPNPIPIVNVPNNITLYTGTPSFSFAQSTINYNLYSGNSGPVFYPQPTASITGVSSEVVTFDVTATDNDLSSGPTCDVTSGSEFSVGTTTVTCTATDYDGGVGTASFDVTVIEQTISGSPTCTPGSNSQFPIGSTPVSCSVTDGQGNASTDTFAVNVQPKSQLSDSQCRAAAGSGHDSDSVFVCEYPFHVTVEEGQRLVWVDTQPWQGFYHHSLTSNNYLFDHTDAGVMDMLPSAWGGVGVYSFYDKLNTALSGSITIAESDTTAPNVDVPNDLVISTEDENGTPIVTYSVSATDDREVTSGPTCDVASGSTFSIGTTEVTCTASDAAGNIGTDSFDVTVEYTYIDETPPGFAAYDDISKTTTNPAGTVVSYTLPTVTDNIGVTSGPTCNVQSGSVFPIGTTQVTCDASDAAGNPASILFNVVLTQTYVDNTAPAVYITFGETSDEIVVAADSSSGKELGFTVNAIDNVGVTVGPICSDAGVSLGLTPSGEDGYYSIDSKMYSIGNSFVVCTAYDAAGNSGSSIFAVTIQPEVADTTPPVITLPSELVNGITISSSDIAEVSGGFISDGYWPDQETIFQRSFYTVSMAGITFSDNVDILEDLGYGPPQGNMPPALSCDNEIRWNENHPSWQGFPLGDTIIACRVSDTSGNMGNAIFTVTAIYTGNVQPSEQESITGSTTTQTEIGNSSWSLRFCAAGHPYDPNPPHCPSSILLGGDGNDGSFVPLTTGYAFDYPGSGSGTISIVNNAGGCTPTVQVSIIDIPEGIQARLSSSPSGSQWHSIETTETPYGSCGSAGGSSGNHLHLKIVDDAPLGPFTMKIRASDGTDTYTLQTSGTIVAVDTGSIQAPETPSVAHITGTMKKSTGSLDFSSSENNGRIVFVSSDNVETVVELNDDSAYDVILLPGEYEVESDYWYNQQEGESENNIESGSYSYEQQSINLSSDQVFDITFPLTTLNGKITDTSGNNLENISISSSAYIFRDGMSVSNINTVTNQQGEFSIDIMSPLEVEDADYNSGIHVTPPENSEYFEKGITNIDPSNTLNIVLDRLADSGVTVTGTMKKSTGSLDFSSSENNGRIVFVSSDNVETVVELNDDSAYDVILLPGEYEVESDYWYNQQEGESENNIESGSYSYEQQSINLSSDQVFDITFPLTTLNGKITDTSGNNLENISISSSAYIFRDGMSVSNINTVTNQQGEFSIDIMSPLEVEDADYNSGIHVTPPENSEYFEKGITNIDPSNTLNIVLDRLADSGVTVTGTMKKSTGSLDFSSSENNGRIVFVSSDNVETVVELNDDSAYDVILLPGEYEVESDYWYNQQEGESENNIESGSYSYEQQSINLSSDQVFDITFPLTTLNGKITDTSGNNLENISISSSAYIFRDGMSVSNINTVTNQQGEFSIDIMSPLEVEDADYNSGIHVTPPENSEYFEKGITNIDPSNTLNIVLDSFEDSGVSIPDSLKFSNPMTFEKYQHFEDSTDFTAISQTFKEGTTFGDGTTFRSDGTQSLPVGTIPSFGVMLEEFSCVTADCKPADTSKFLSPGELLLSGIDPAASFSRITSADKSFTIDGLGLTMTFDNVFGDGTIKTDLYDPVNIPSSTDAGNGKVSVITNTSESISTIGSVIDLSVDTATVSGSITITMPYLESNIPAGTAESDLVVLHYTNNQWVTESNCTVDTLNNKITCTVTELSPFGIGSRSVTPTSEDENLDVDTTPPEFEEVNNILVDATTSNGATVTYEIPMATDDGGITDTPVCEPESGSFFSIGTTPVTCTVKDIAGIQGATVFLVTVKSLIAAPVEIPNDISIKIGKSDYNTKEAIFVSGVASPFTEDKVSINVQDQSDNLVLVEQITPESSGIYTGIIFPNSLWSTSGNYTMSATYGTATDSTPFTFEFLQTEIDNSNIPTGITLNTNATGYALGDVISVTSQLTGGTSGQSIIIDVKDESGDNVVLQSLNTDDSGSTSLSFKAQDNWIPGTYNVTARDGSALWDYSTSELIQLVRPLPDITISPTITTTESGDEITSYKAGEIGYFSTSLLSESTSNVLVTINVVDSEGATLGVAFFKSIIGKGDSEIVLGFKIPEDAADGVAKIYVNTYTDWIDQGGIVISSELLSEVNIEGVISVENISDDGTVLVTPKSGSSIPGCEQSIQGCYLPNPTIINVGDTVSFSNTDTEPHTFTSGSPSNGPNGIFDSSVLMSGEKYEFTFENEGKYDYFDMIRPWMVGTIVVGNSESFTVLPENIIPKFSDISDITQSASSSVGNAISYPLPIAIGGVITSGTTCTPAPGSMFPIGSTQVTCTATNDFGNTGMTSFMVTINPIPQTADQSLSVKVGKDLYNNLEPLFVTGSVGKITGDSINLEVYDELNHLISIEQTTPKESGVYNTIITSNELWSNSGEYTIIAKYDSASAQDTFEFELIEVEKIISEQIPTELYVSTDNSVYILGDDVFIDMQLVDAGAGEPILLEVRDSQNDQVLLQSLNTDSDGNADISYQLESTHDSGIYSVIVTSANWDFITTETFVAVAQIPDIIVGDVVPTLQDGTEVDSFEVGDIGYFQTPIISNSTSNVLIAVNIFDVENTPLGLAYFNSKVVDDTFDIVLGLQIPENVTPGLATVYINTYTDWADEGGVPILEEQVSFIEISPSSVSDLTLSTNPISTNSTETVP